MASARLCLVASTAATFVTLVHGLLTGLAQTPVRPTFRAAVELVGVDVQIIDRDGHPVDGLTTSDFEVWINNSPRRVLSADLIRYPLSTAAQRLSMSALVRPETPATVDGRMVIIAVDEASLTLESARNVMNAARWFVRGLPSEDVVGVYTFPFSVQSLDLRHDRLRVGNRLDTVTGRFMPPSGKFALSTSELIDITAGDRGATDQIGARECPEYVINRPACLRDLDAEAFTKAAYFEAQYLQSLGELRTLLRGLGALPGRKIVVLVSGGLTMPDRTGGRPDMTSMMKSAVADASAAGASLYILHVDTTESEAFSPAQKSTIDASARFASLGRDRRAHALGLERLAGEAGGAVFREQGGAGEVAFARILRETSAFYLLGVETRPADRDGRVHFVRIKANAKGATVRARSQLVIARRGP